MTIENYWPSLEEINNCIKDQAENSSDAVLLSVHQEFPLAYSIVGQDGKVIQSSKKTATEDDLLKYFLSNAPSGTHVVPITGLSGVGKSHLIRILDAKIKRLPNSDKYLVIRIPKSASLRKVVDLILSAEPLNSSEYDIVKSEFSKAMADVDPENAVITFQAQLEIALKEYSNKQREAFNQNPTDILIKRKIAHADSLPLLISDAEIVKHFRANVLPRIIHRTVRGDNVVEESEEFLDANTSKFRVEDFNFEGIDISNSNRRVSTYYQLNFLTESSRERDLAVEVLNEVIDQATNQLYQLNQSLGGKTLAEVILDIRSLLLKQGKELVLLVEDFAALIGIQDTLSKVLIHEGYTSKGNEYATIRSAIAVTDGYLSEKSTLATRAGQEWVVESRLESEDEILTRTKKLVASYLNAARIGENKLQTQYKKIIKNNSQDKYIPPIFEEDIDDSYSLLEPFGKIDGVPLFPFNDHAIEYLAFNSASLKSGNSLIFNPRFIIKNIIRFVLERKESFLEKQFPPVELSTRKPTADIQNWSSELRVPVEIQKRYERLVTIWGNDPKNRNEIPARIKPTIFEVFTLKPPEFNGLEKISVDTNSARPTTKAPVVKEIDQRITLKVEKYDKLLEDWVVDKVKLEFTLSNKFRKRVALLLTKRIDWNAERMKEIPIKSTQISIYNAAGEGNISNADLINLVEDPSDPKGILRKDLLGLIRYTEYSEENIQDYDDLENDLVRIANLVDRLMPQAMNIIHQASKKHTTAIVKALNVTGKVLGEIETGLSVPCVRDSLLNNIQPIEVLPEYSSTKFIEWINFKQKLLLVRPTLQSYLAEVNGCFQGSGDKCYGVDVTKILRDAPDITGPIDYDDIYNLDPAIKSLLQDLSSNLKIEARLKPVRNEIKKIVDSIDSEFGEQFDKTAIADSIERIGQGLKERGEFDNEVIGISFNQFKTLLSEFRNSALKESISTFIKSNESDMDESKKISYLSRIPLGPLSTTEQFIQCSLKIIAAIENKAKMLETQYKGLNKSEKINAINSAFNDLLGNIGTMEKATNHESS